MNLKLVCGLLILGLFVVQLPNNQPCVASPPRASDQCILGDLDANDMPFEVRDVALFAAIIMGIVEVVDGFSSEDVNQECADFSKDGTVDLMDAFLFVEAMEKYKSGQAGL